MRYELVLIKENSEEYGINFIGNVEGIDQMTTNFENEAELLRFLDRNGYDVSNTSNVKIRYVYNQKLISLDVCYMDDAIFSIKTDKFEIDDKKHRTMVNDFISSLRDGKFVRYIKEAKNEGGKILYPELIEAIDDYTYGGREVSLNPIHRVLTSYKQTRDVYFLTKKYREKEFVNNHEANPYSSDREEMTYQKYLEDLPGEYEEEKHERIKLPIKKYEKKN